MINLKTYRALIWGIIILFATNLSMGISFVYHKQQDKKSAEKVEEMNIEMPARQRTRFFREELDLTPEQVNKFREWNREFNRAGWTITRQLEELRMQMITELGNETPDQQQLDKITNEIGKLHSELKKATIDYYLKMKGECNEEQKSKLNDIFISMLEKNENVKLPDGNGRNRGEINNIN